MQTIYALYNDSTNKPFYVGRTSRSIEQRYQEHVYASKNQPELKYEYIRELIKRNISFSIKALATIDDNESTQQYEDHYLCLFLEQGYQLTNMKKGDLEHIALLRRIKTRQYSEQLLSTIHYTILQLVHDVAAFFSPRTLASTSSSYINLTASSIRLTTDGRVRLVKNKGTVSIQLHTKQNPKAAITLTAVDFNRCRQPIDSLPLLCSKLLTDNDINVDGVELFEKLDWILDPMEGMTL